MQTENSNRNLSAKKINCIMQNEKNRNLPKTLMVLCKLKTVTETCPKIIVLCKLKTVTETCVKKMHTENSNKINHNCIMQTENSN